MKHKETRQAHLKYLCTSLRLTRLRKDFEIFAAQAERQKMSYEDFMVYVFENELADLHQRRLEQRIKRARFPFTKTLDTFDFSKAKELPESHIIALATCEFIPKAEPIIFLGEPGTGKTHLAIALGFAAASRGFNIRFTTIAQLANQLIEAKNSRELSKIIYQYTKPHLLIIDELGFVPLSKADAELIFQVLSARQETRPIILTTNLPFSEWTSVFTDPRLCKAVIDRITHRAHIIETGMQSIRLAQTLQLRQNTK